MPKVAKLVEFSLLVRVLVEEGVNDDVIIAASYDKVLEKLDNRELGDNLISIEDDTECPFGTSPNDEEDGVITHKMIKNASQFLSTDNNSNEEVKAMVKLILEHEDENEIIDYIDGVLVWEKVIGSFTCEQFMEEIS